MDIFAALADPTRRKIFEVIAAGEVSVSEIVKQFPVSAPAISQHLQILREANLVQVRADKQRRLYSVRQQALVQLEDWVHYQQEAMAARLDALDRHLSSKKPGN